MSELKPLPCPFCGGINIINCGLHKYCHSCGAEGPDADNGTDAGLLSAWNRRAQPAQAGQVLSDDELRELEKKFNAERVRTSDEEYLVIYPSDYYEWQRAIEQAVLAKRVPMPPEDWSVFNSGAEVASGLTWAEAWDYMTPSRIERGWTAVCVADKSNIGIVGKEGA